MREKTGKVACRSTHLWQNRANWNTQMSNVVKCSQCDKAAVVQLYSSDDEPGVTLCVDCNLKYEQAKAIEYERMSRTYNKLARSLQSSLGIPIATFSESPMPQMDQYVMNNIRIDQSTIGVLNTGNIQTVDSAVTVLSGQSDSEDASAAIAKFTQAVIDSQEATDEIKNEILELLSIVATEATAPAEKRRGQAVKSMLTTIANIVSSVAGLAQLWEQYSLPILALFGLL